jgi:putative molybdopterin biosynthesis protein
MTLHKSPHRVELAYSLVRAPSAGDWVLHPLFQMLDAVERRGSISAAARMLGLSYRHVWGELKRWEEEFGRLLIVWEKGQKAKLTEFGQKLLWAERQAQSRLAPQIASLRADLERAFGMAFNDKAHVLMVNASHDDALSAFRDHVSDSGLFLDIRFSGSLDALTALAEGRASVAGFHCPIAGQVHEEIRQKLLTQYRSLLSNKRCEGIGFARREVGLIVEPGNPLKLRGLEDLLTGRYRFVNRSLGTGTRLFLDAWLDYRGKTGQDLKGYRYEEPSHSAVAEAIRVGAADAGLGLAHSAGSRGLGFIPLFEEGYWLAMHRDGLNEPSLKALVVALQDPMWHSKIGGLIGYRPIPEVGLAPTSEILL